MDACIGILVEIKRNLVKSGTVRGGSHWRYVIEIKTTENSTKEIIVPFPQVIQNQHLQDLILRIKSVNGNIEWVKMEE